MKVKCRRILDSAALRRSSNTISVIDGNAYIHGGELLPREPVDSDIYQVDLKTGAFSQRISSTNEGPQPRVGSASTTINGRVYIFSGRGGVEMAPIEEQGSFWVYDSTSNTWSQLVPEDSQAPYPAGRSYHCLSNDGSDTIYLHAGCPEKGRLDDLWAFDIVKRQWNQLVSAPEPARGGASIAFSGGKLYRMNGFDGDSEQGGSIDKYDPISNAWTSSSFTPDGRNGPTARSVSCLLPVTIAGKPMLVTMFGESDPSNLGHQGAGKMLGDIWMYDGTSKTWTSLEFGEEFPEPRGWFSADVLPSASSVVVQGGLAESNERLGDLWILDLES